MAFDEGDGRNLEAGGSQVHLEIDGEDLGAAAVGRRDELQDAADGA